MIDRREFENFLLNKCNCKPGHGTDVTLSYKGSNGQVYNCTFGNHKKRKVSRNDAFRFIRDLHLEGKDYDRACEEYDLG